MPDVERAARPRLQPGAGHVPGRRLGQARHRRARDRADRPRLAPRRGLDRLGDDRRATSRSRASTAAGRSRSRRPTAATFRVRFVESDAEAYDRFYNIIANPMLWFIQHYLWDLSNAPDIRRHEVEAFEYGYNVVNEDLARGRAARRSRARTSPVVMVHDYHLYTLPAMVRRGAPGRLPAPLRPHPVDAAGRLARAADARSATRSTTGCWPTTSSASTRAPTGATSCSAAAT